MDAALSQIVTDAPSGPVPPLTTALPVPASPDVKVDPETQAVMAYRATLAQEEARLAARGPNVPPPVVVPTGGFVPSAFGASAQDVLIRGDADPLHVASFQFLRRIVAGGSPLLAMVDVPALTRHMTALREAVEYKAPATPKADPPKKVVDG